MNENRKQKFMDLWSRFFPGADLPIGFYYTHEPRASIQCEKDAEGWHCFIAQLGAVRSGKQACFTLSSIGCVGGRRYLGFSTEIRENFRYFLSCGIEGQLEGERYKKTPELVDEILRNIPPFTAPAPYVVFKRWDLFEADEEPEVVVFFAEPDVLSGLFTLAGYDESDLNGVIAPFGSGCATIVAYPQLERQRERPRAVLGMFDVSSRPCVPKDKLSMAVPMEKFARMIDNMEESFLTRHSWDKVKKRL